MRQYKCIALILCFLLTVSLLVPTTLVAEEIDLDQSTSLTMVFAPDGVSPQGIEFKVYRVAERNSSGGFSPLEPFKSWPVQITDTDVKDWPALASTLEVYVTMNGTVPTQTAVTDHQGKAVFSDLQSGFYLVVGDPVEGDGEMYVPQPVMLSLPILQDGKYLYDVIANAKYDVIPISSGDETSELQVIKIWEISEGKKHPAEVKVQLLRNGQVWDTVTLNKDNNWRYIWTDLQEGSLWKVVEVDVPKGYTVSIARNGDIFSVINTDESDDNPDDSNKPEDDEEEKLPQTGMLWWPVPFLAVSGMGCFLAGWVRDRKDKDHEA